jgi:hypothetical protein
MQTASNQHCSANGQPGSIRYLSKGSIFCSFIFCLKALKCNTEILKIQGGKKWCWEEKIKILKVLKERKHF